MYNIEVSFLALQSWKFTRTERAQILKKKVLGIYKIALRLRGRHAFMWQSVENSNDFNTLTLKKIFLKTETFFKKLV